MKWLVVVLLCACGAGMSGKGAEPPFRSAKTSEFADELAQASGARDIARVRALLRDSVTLGGLWFSDVACMRQFSSAGEVRGEKLDELARCLASLELARSERIDALPDVVVLTYGNGIELEARFVERDGGPWLTWIGYAARRNMEDALPSVSAKSLEALRVEGDPRAPMLAPTALSDIERTKGAHAWLKVCIDAMGTVTGAHVREATSPATARTFAAATKTWKFRPFVLGSQPVPVCAMVRMRAATTHDARATEPEMLPLPTPEIASDVINVPSAVLTRIGGETHIAPGDADKARMDHAGIRRTISAFHYCIDEQGRVSRAQLLRSSGLPMYDARLAAAIRTWVFQPFLDEGRPVPVCSSVHFVYNQSKAGLRVRRR